MKICYAGISLSIISTYEVTSDRGMRQPVIFGRRRSNITHNVVEKKAKYSREKFWQQMELQFMVIPGILFLVIFSYIPMAGIIIACKEYNLINGLFSGKWVGFKYFIEFLTDEKFLTVLRNTLGINVMGLVIKFPIPIIFALLLNELAGTHFKKFVQTVTYLPHFISWVIFGGILLNLMTLEGPINAALQSVGFIDKPVNFIGKANCFWWIAVLSTVLKEFGFSAIIYIAAISGIDQEMYEAADIDGVGRFQKIGYITLPSIAGTIVIMLILAISNVMNTGFEQIYILQNPLNLSMSETIDTFVYKVGITNLRFSYSTAVGVFKSVISVILLVGANYISRKITDKSLF